MNLQLASADRANTHEKKVIKFSSNSAGYTKIYLWGNTESSLNDVSIGSSIVTFSFSVALCKCMILYIKVYYLFFLGFYYIIIRYSRQTLQIAQSSLP